MEPHSLQLKLDPRVFERIGSRLKVRAKIALTLCLVIGLATGVLGTVALHNASLLGQRLQSMHQDAILPLMQAEAVNDCLDMMRIATLKAIHLSGKHRERALIEISARQKDFSVLLAKYEQEHTLAAQPDMREMLSRYGKLEDQVTREQNALRNIRRDYPLLLSTVGQISSLLREEKMGAVNQNLVTSADDLFTGLDESTNTLMNIQLEQTSYAQIESKKILTATRQQIAAALFFALVVGFIAWAVLATVVMTPLRVLRKATRQVAAGNLHDIVRINSKDEFGELAHSFNNMMRDLDNARQISAANESRLLDAQEIAHVGSWEWDIRQNKVTWSDELYRVFGLQPQEFGGTYEAYLDHIHPDDRQFVDDNVASAIRTGIFPSFDNRVIRKDGSVATIRAAGKVAFDADGNAVRMTGTAHDITERVQMQTDLEQARDKALESARLKAEFLANMSHEIRTPMNGVIGMTGLLLDSELTAEQKEYAEIIRSSGESLLVIINDILDFSKIEAGKLHFEMEDFDLREVVESSVELLAERAQAKGIELASLVHSDVPTRLRSDAGRLRQVLTNLISNAVKFTEAGEAVLCCSKVSETVSEAVVRFAVRDTGVGISSEAQRNLFQAFVQADGTTTRKYGGTGLGLAISKQLVEMMGGAISVRSEPGKGSCFSFTLHLQKQREDTNTAHIPLTSLKGLRVLVVDDNATNRKILVHQTSSWGMLPTAVDSGKSGLAFLREAHDTGWPFDVALLDVLMPEMNGLELARAIKADPRLAALQLVLMPSFGQREDCEAAKAGLGAYLVKPVRQRQLYDCLTKLLAAPGAAPSVTVPLEPAALKPVSQTRVLIAEDNMVNQKVAIMQLRHLGYRADVVANGAEVLEALARIPYDVVLMDCHMPEMDGFAATEEIRRGEAGTRHTVIIAMTANAQAGDRERCLASGMDDYVSKPVDVLQLQRALERWQMPEDRERANAAAVEKAPIRA
ncbi:MAG TPA: response regulator [Bryobacteraceae bacterium]|nr:response regulator [Bryobacteraceae bacterium]